MQNGWCCPLATTEQKAAPQKYTHTLHFRLKGQMSQGRFFDTRNIKGFIFSFPLKLRNISIFKTRFYLQICRMAAYTEMVSVHSSSF